MKQALLWSMIAIGIALVGCGDEECVDQDADGYGSFCEAGEDCDDQDRTRFKQWKHVFVDTDGDGYGAGEAVSVCAGSIQPNGYSDNNLDCDDNDDNKYALQMVHIDTDGDGFGFGGEQELCTGSSLPKGYSLNDLDCDDSDPALFTMSTFFVDADSDGIGEAQTEEVCSNGTNPPEGYSLLDSDCLPEDSRYFQESIGYQDADTDGYGAGEPRVVCVGEGYPAGFASSNIDCDDKNPEVFLGLEGFTDIDEDGVGVGSVIEFCTNGALPSHFAANLLDCNDNDPNVWQTCDSCTDIDQDGYFMFCDAYRTIAGPDCDDNDFLRHPAMLELPADDIDQNCDGADLEVNSDAGVFVDLYNGSAHNTGTRESPFASLADGLSLAMKEHKVLFVAQGTYNESIEPRISIFGGYEGESWIRNTDYYKTRIVGNLSKTIIVPDGSSLVIAGLEIVGNQSGVLSSTMAMEIGQAVFLVVDDSFIDAGRATNESVGLSWQDVQHVIIKDSIINGGQAQVTRSLWGQGTGFVSIVGNTVTGGDAEDETIAVEIASPIVFIRNTIEAGTTTTHGVVEAVAARFHNDSWIYNNLFIGSQVQATTVAISQVIELATQGMSDFIFNTVVSGQATGGSIENISVGCSFYEQGQSRVINNIFYNGNIGIEVINPATPALLDLRNNDFYGQNAAIETNVSVGSENAINQCNWDGCLLAQNNRMVDPQLTSEYYLHDTSECIDAGTDIFNTFPSAFYSQSFSIDFHFDLDNNERCLEGSCDLGAYTW